MNFCFTCSLHAKNKNQTLNCMTVSTFPIPKALLLIMTPQKFNNGFILYNIILYGYIFIYMIYIFIYIYQREEKKGRRKEQREKRKEEKKERKK